MRSLYAVLLLLLIGCGQEPPPKQQTLAEAKATAAALEQTFANMNRHTAAHANDGPGRFQFKSGKDICLLDTITGDLYAFSSERSKWIHIPSPLDVDKTNMVEVIAR